MMNFLENDKNKVNTWENKEDEYFKQSENVTEDVNDLKAKMKNFLENDKNKVKTWENKEDEYLKQSENSIKNEDLKG